MELDNLKEQLAATAKNWQARIELAPMDIVAIGEYTFKKTKVPALEKPIWLCDHKKHGSVGIPCYDDNLYYLCLDIAYHKTIKDLENCRRKLNLKDKAK
jgi:hypothetical protein